MLVEYIGNKDFHINRKTGLIWRGAGFENAIPVEDGLAQRMIAVHPELYREAEPPKPAKRREDERAHVDPRIDAIQIKWKNKQYILSRAPSDALRAYLSEQKGLSPRDDDSREAMFGMLSAVLDAEEAAERAAAKEAEAEAEAAEAEAAAKQAEAEAAGGTAQAEPAAGDPAAT